MVQDEATLSENDTGAQDSQTQLEFEDTQRLPGLPPRDESDKRKNADEGGKTTRTAKRVKMSMGLGVDLCD